MQGKKLHGHFVAELELIHVQLDELWANVKDNSQDLWLWVATDVKTELIPVLQVGGETRRWRLRSFTNYKERLSAGCVPVFSTDGLRQYFYALNAHFGKWEAADGKKPVRVLMYEFVYGQVIKYR